MNRMDFWAGMALAGLTSYSGSGSHATAAWNMAEAMENRRKEIKDLVDAAEELPKGKALTNEAVAQLVADLASDGRRWLSTVKALEDALPDADSQ